MSEPPASPRNPWNTVFARQGHVFDAPHESMPELVGALRVRGATRLLDLGCGNGRHLVYFAKHGFTVSGLDSSPEGLSLAESWLESEGLVGDLRMGSMTDPLPYNSGIFDAVVAVQVIHHARVAQIRSLVAEIDRVLRPGGLVFVSVPMLRKQAKSFEEIEPGTLVPLDGIEKGLPHHYFDVQELQATFQVFEMINLKPDAVHHLCLLAEKSWSAA